MKCRLCGSGDEYLSIRAEHVFGGKKEHKFYECRNCKAIFLEPKLTPEEEKTFYLKEFEKFMSSRVGDHRDWSNADKHRSTNQDQVKRRMPFLEDYLISGAKILEISIPGLGSAIGSVNALVGTSLP